MPSWPLDLLRELRWWRSPYHDPLAGACLPAGWQAFFCGAFAAILVLSPSCRRLAVLTLQTAIGLIAPATSPVAGDLRGRLAQYRQHSA